MSEGGLFPWKRQTITGNPGDYSCLSSPLPNPPKGQTWVRNPQTREWSIIDTAAAEQKEDIALEIPVAVPININSTSNDNTMYGSTSKSTSKSTTQKQQLLISENCDYLQHHVEPTDTLQGICLQYGVKPVTLRQANKFSGSNLMFAPEMLIIPLLRNVNVNAKMINGDGNKEEGNKDDNLNSIQNGKEVQINQFILAFRRHKASTMISRKEAVAYLDMNDWNLEMAIQDAKDDFGWEIGENENSSLL
jgi:hypothetical protein